jgi:hypothetical protein
VALLLQLWTPDVYPVNEFIRRRSARECMKVGNTA